MKPFKSYAICLSKSVILKLFWLIIDRLSLDQNPLWVRESSDLIRVLFLSLFSHHAGGRDDLSVIKTVCHT